MVHISDSFPCFKQEAVLRFTVPTIEVIVLDLQLDVTRSSLGIRYSFFAVTLLEFGALSNDVTGFVCLDFRQD